jgi:hypothetical protein
MDESEEDVILILTFDVLTDSYPTGIHRLFCRRRHELEQIICKHLHTHAHTHAHGMNSSKCRHSISLCSHNEKRVCDICSRCLNVLLRTMPKLRLGS